MLADLIFLQFIICPSSSQHLRASDTSPERRKKHFVMDERMFSEFSTPWAPIRVKKVACGWHTAFFVRALGLFWDIDWTVIR